MNAQQPYENIERLRTGRLLTPRDMDTVGTTLTKVPDFNGYALLLSLPDVHLRHLEQARNKVPIRFTLYPMRTGYMLAVVTIQSGNFQARAAIPLIGEQSLAWLDWCIQNKTLACFVDVPETNQLALLQSPHPFPDAKAMRALVHVPEDLTAEDVLGALVPATLELLKNETLSSYLPGETVDEVQLFVISNVLEGPEYIRTMEDAVGPMH